VREGGIPGVVIKLGRGFGKITIEDDSRIRAGAGVPDTKVARAAADAGIAGLAFLRGIPGAIGGLLRMNGGAYGKETSQILVSVKALDRKGAEIELSLEDMKYEYRHSGASEDLIFVEGLFQGMPGDKETIRAEMKDITEAREESQPVKSHTGGSTFKNPDGHKAWQLIDDAGCRGLRVGGAQVSEKHCNFLINNGDATATDLENLGETVRRRVKETSGIELEWEIRRVGIPAIEMLAPEMEK
jgi:UDP-N-acetylmuramate dehydrogenase